MQARKARLPREALSLLPSTGGVPVRVDVNGVSIEYEVIGGDGAPVVLHD
jgi:hypothetical protein